MKLNILLLCKIFHELVFETADIEIYLIAVSVHNLAFLSFTWENLYKDSE